MTPNNPAVAARKGLISKTPQPLPVRRSVRLSGLTWLFLSSLALAQSVTNVWVSPTNGVWSGSGNWSQGRVPVFGDVVMFNTNSPFLGSNTACTVDTGFTVWDVQELGGYSTNVLWQTNITATCSNDFIHLAGGWYYNTNTTFDVGRNYRQANGGTGGANLGFVYGESVPINATINMFGTGVFSNGYTGGSTYTVFIDNFIAGASNNTVTCSGSGTLAVDSSIQVAGGTLNLNGQNLFIFNGENNGNSHSPLLVNPVTALPGSVLSGGISFYTSAYACSPCSGINQDWYPLRNVLTNFSIASVTAQGGAAGGMNFWITNGVYAISHDLEQLAASLYIYNATNSCGQQRWYGSVYLSNSVVQLNGELVQIGSTVGSALSVVSSTFTISNAFAGFSGVDDLSEYGGGVTFSNSVLNYKVAANVGGANSGLTLPASATIKQSTFYLNQPGGAATRYNLPCTLDALVINGNGGSFASAITCNSLVVSNGSISAAGGNVTVNTNLWICGGTYFGSNLTTTVGLSAVLCGGTFVPQTGTLQFGVTSTTATNGFTNMWNLACTTPGKCLVFTNAPINIAGTFTAQGSAASNIVLKTINDEMATITLSGRAILLFCTPLDLRITGSYMECWDGTGTTTNTSGNLDFFPRATGVSGTF